MHAEDSPLELDLEQHRFEAHGLALMTKADFVELAAKMRRDRIRAYTAAVQRDVRSLAAIERRQRWERRRHLRSVTP